LSNVQRKWVFQARVEDKSISQIAAEEQVNIETVKYWKRHALKKIRRNLEAQKE
jgi:DNA-directed RNA polymerase specialized sigma24 family protein